MIDLLIDDEASAFRIVSFAIQFLSSIVLSLPVKPPYTEIASFISTDEVRVYVPSATQTSMDVPGRIVSAAEFNAACSVNFASDHDDPLFASLP